MRLTLACMILAFVTTTPVPAQDRQRPLMHSAAEQGAVLVAAHRGGYDKDKANHAPENSLANLRLAINKGYDVYETDIQRTADGVFVIVHDATLDRETNGTGAVADLNLKQLKALRKRYRDGSISGQPVATLAELLKAGKGKILFKPDLKPGIIEHFEDLAQLIFDLQMTDQVFLRTGISDAKAIKSHFANGCPQTEVMFKANNADQVGKIISAFGPKTIQINLAKGESISKAKTEAIQIAVERGVLVETHTYSDPERWQKLAQLGVRMFHTANPDKTLAYLRDNGWRQGLEE